MVYDPVKVELGEAVDVDALLPRFWVLVRDSFIKFRSPDLLSRKLSFDGSIRVSIIELGYKYSVRIL